jgi:hypothetical protein
MMDSAGQHRRGSDAKGQIHDIDADPTHLFNCLFYGFVGGMAVYHDFDGGGAIMTASEAETDLQGESIPATGSLDGDPMFEDLDGPDGDLDTMDDNDWHLSASTDVLITEGGLDRSESYTTDIEWADRTYKWSIGAYEYDEP